MLASVRRRRDPPCPVAERQSCDRALRRGRRRRRASDRGAHSGAQTTADTVALAVHAAEAGADAVAVIAPPYFALDDARCTCISPSRPLRVRRSPVLRLRVRGAFRIRGVAVGCRTSAQRGAEPARAEGLRFPVGEGRALLDRRARRLHRRARRSSRVGSRMERRVRCRGSRRCTRKSSPRSCAIRRRSVPPKPSGCARRGFGLKGERRALRPPWNVPCFRPHNLICRTHDRER